MYLAKSAVSISRFDGKWAKYICVLYLEKRRSWQTMSGLQLFPALKHLTRFCRYLSLFQEKPNPTAVSANCQDWRSPLPHSSRHSSLWLPWYLWLCLHPGHHFLPVLKGLISPAVPPRNVKPQFLLTQTRELGLQADGAYAPTCRGYSLPLEDEGVGWAVCTLLLVEQVVAVMQFWLRDVRSLPYAHCCGVQMLSDRSYVTAMSSTTYRGRPMSETTRLSQQANFYWLTPIKGFLKVAPEVTRKHHSKYLPAATGAVRCPPSFCYFIITKVTVSHHAVLHPPWRAGISWLQVCHLVS